MPPRAAPQFGGCFGCRNARIDVRPLLSIRKIQAADKQFLHSVPIYRLCPCQRVSKACDEVGECGGS